MVKEMEKYGVETEAPQVKTGSSVKTCPVCGRALQKGLSTHKCPECGTNPFEGGTLATKPSDRKPS